MAALLVVGVVGVHGRKVAQDVLRRLAAQRTVLRPSHDRSLGPDFAQGSRRVVPSDV